MTDSRTSQLPTTGENAPMGEVLVEGAPGAVVGAERDALASEVLVEEVSIDGMCGVY